MREKFAHDSTSISNKVRRGWSMVRRRFPRSSDGWGIANLGHPVTTFRKTSQGNMSS
jgi:hypothetical protein